MVGGDISGTSRRCKECKSKRKKCDLTEPSCLRCLRSGTRCSGITRRSVFVNHQRDSFALETPRAALRRAYGARSVLTDRPHRLHHLSLSRLQDLRTLWIHHQLRSTLPQDQTLLSRRSVYFEPLYIALLDEFQPKKPTYGGIFSADRAPLVEVQHYSAIAICVRSLLPVAAQRVKVLEPAVFCLLTLYYGRLHADNGLVEMSRSAYITALNQFHRQLEDHASNTTQNQLSLLRASIALQFYEHVASINIFDQGHTAHIDGALKLLSSGGPEMLSHSQDLRVAVSSLKPVAAYLAIFRRKPIFLSEPAWRGSEHSIREELFDLGLEIPTLLNSADDLLLGLQNGHLQHTEYVDQCLHLLLQFGHTWSELDDWFDALRQRTPGPLYWHKNRPFVLAVPAVPRTDMECTPKQVTGFHQLSFMYGTIAGLLMQFWAFRLELLMTMIDIRKKIIAHSESKYVRQFTFGLIAEEQSNADGISQLICEAQVYLDSCLEGFICAQLPLKTVEKYFNRTSV